MIDTLGSPIKEGDMVLTNKYRSSCLTEITTVKKVTHKHVHVEIPATWWNYKEKRLEEGLKVIKRLPHQIVVIDKQLKYNRKNYPENCI